MFESVICFYLHATMKTIAYEQQIFTHCENPDDQDIWHILRLHKMLESYVYY